MWEVAWYEYQMIQRENPHAQLVIVGNFSDEIRDCNFDFYNQERYRYIGIIETPELMASVYRGCNSLLMTYYNDACSNTLIESMMCGCMPVFRGLGYTGGSQQIVNTYATKGRSFFSLKRMTRDYIKLFESL
jgi:glycosyltransferase involved in cell wall biosynthesis